MANCTRRTAHRENFAHSALSSHRAAVVARALLRVDVTLCARTAPHTQHVKTVETQSAHPAQMSEASTALRPQSCGDAHTTSRQRERRESTAGKHRTQRRAKTQPCVKKKQHTRERTERETGRGAKRAQAKPERKQRASNANSSEHTDARNAWANAGARRCARPLEQSENFTNTAQAQQH